MVRIDRGVQPVALAIWESVNGSILLIMSRISWSCPDSSLDAYSCTVLFEPAIEWLYMRLLVSTSEVLCYFRLGPGHAVTISWPVASLRLANKCRRGTQALIGFLLSLMLQVASAEEPRTQSRRDFFHIHLHLLHPSSPMHFRSSEEQSSALNCLDIQLRMMRNLKGLCSEHGAAKSMQPVIDAVSLKQAGCMQYKSFSIQAACSGIYSPKSAGPKLAAR